MIDHPSSILEPNGKVKAYQQSLKPYPSPGLEMDALFNTSKQNISLHIRNILAEGELAEVATVKESLTVQTEGKRQMRRSSLLYNPDMILAVGYRGRSVHGAQFRQWATIHLHEYLV